MGLITWLRRRTRGVEDPARDADLTTTDQRHFIYYTIDNAPFQKWVVFVAAVGFFTDAYDIFALNVISQILPYIYGDGSGKLAPNLQAALLVSTLAGTLIGQVSFGFLADRYGRRKMYGFELIVLIIGSIGSAMSSEGRGSMSIWGWLVAWRLAMGAGIGADYPLSAVIASEFAPKKHRARMLAFVFWMQPVGQVIVLAIALVTVKASQAWLSDCNPSQIDTCVSNLDSVWRWVVGLGAVPAALAISFRMTIPQSPRFLMDNKKEIDKAARKTAAYFGSPNVPFSVQMTQVAPLKPVTIVHEEERRHDSFELPPAATASGPDFITDNIHISRTASRISSSSVASSVSAPPIVEAVHYPAPEDELNWREYFLKQGNWRLLAGTAGTWFLLDIPFYGLGLSSASIVNTVWRAGGTNAPESTMYDILLDTLLRTLIIVSLGGLVGGAIFLKVVQHVSPRTIQFYGFLVLTVLLLVTGVAFPALAEAGGTGPIILYVLIQLFFYLGPNTTTYLIPAELFPTQYRCTCHGLSAAAGRLGGICAQLFVTFAQFNGNTLADGLQSRPSLSNTEGTSAQSSAALRGILVVFCVFTALGAGLTYLLTPDTRDKAGNPRSLETLARGYAYLAELKGNTAPEDRERAETS